MDHFILSHYEGALSTAFYGSIILLALAEFVWPWRTSRHSLISRWSSNFGLGVIQLVLARILVPIGLFKLSIEAQQHGWGLFNLVPIPGLIALVVGVLLLDLLKYAEHRVSHAVPILWRAHVVHHADLEIDFTTGFRHHPIEVILTAVPSAVVVLAFGLSPAAVAVFQILAVTVAVWTHVNVRLPAWLDRALRQVVVTPEMHIVHHSAHRIETDSNYGIVFPWWDRMFRTYRAQSQDGPTTMPIGLEYFRTPGDLRLDRCLTMPFRVPIDGEAQQEVAPDRAC